MKFDHFGVVVGGKVSGMVHYPEFHVWCTDYEKDPFRIERIFFEPGNQFPALIKQHPHICYSVENLEKALEGKKVLLPPKQGEGFRFAFIESDGIPIEFMEYK